MIWFKLKCRLFRDVHFRIKLDMFKIESHSISIFSNQLTSSEWILITSLKSIIFIPLSFRCPKLVIKSWRVSLENTICFRVAIFLVPAQIENWIWNICDKFWLVVNPSAYILTSICWFLIPKFFFNSDFETLRCSL